MLTNKLLIAAGLLVLLAGANAERVRGDLDSQGAPIGIDSLMLTFISSPPVTVLTPHWGMGGVIDSLDMDFPDWPDETITLFVNFDGNAQSPVAIREPVIDTWYPVPVRRDTALVRFRRVNAVEEERAPLSDRVSLTVPGPATCDAHLEWSQGKAAHAELSVRDVRGRLVRTLVSGHCPPGRHTQTWDAADCRGARVPAGVYLIRLTVAGATIARKLIIMR